MSCQGLEELSRLRRQPPLSQYPLCFYPVSVTLAGSFDLSGLNGSPVKREGLYLAVETGGLIG